MAKNNPFAKFQKPAKGAKEMQGDPKKGPAGKKPMDAKKGNPFANKK